MRRTLVAVTVLFAFPGAASAQLPVASSTLLSSSGPAQVGERLDLSAAVSALTVPVTGGTVDFRDGAVLVCEDVPVVSGTAGCDVVPSTAGTHAYTAQFSGLAGTLGGTSLPLLVDVQKALVTVTAAPRTITYGDALPADLTATVTGTAAGLLSGTPACSVEPGTPTSAGTHDDAIVCVANTLDVLNFLPVFVPGDLTIARAPATVTANPVTMTAGEALPTVTSTVTGLIGSDTIDVACAGPDPLPAEPGTYPGALKCLADPLNYAVTLVPGTLTVLASTVGGLPGTVTGAAGSGSGPGGGSTTNNTTTNVTNVAIVGGSGGTTAPRATLSLLTKKLKRTKRARLKLRSSGAITSLRLVLKRDGKSVGKGALAALDGQGSVTVKASKKLKKGFYTLQATWAGGGKKRFNVRVR